MQRAFETIVPKIQTVRAIDNKRLLIHFVNGVNKLYDCTPLLKLERFQPLQSDALFRSVQVDTGGYGISWNDEIDLSEDELWHTGVETSQELDESEIALDSAIR